MRYIMVIHTPVGMFKSKAKEDTDSVVEDKMRLFPNNYPDGINLTTEHGTIAKLSYNLLTNSVMEIVKL